MFDSATADFRYVEMNKSEVNCDDRSNIIAELNGYLLGKCKPCDVALIVGQKVFGCHRKVLMSCCQYFNSMFSHFRESSQEVIELHNVDSNGLRLLFNIFYYGNFLYLNSSSFSELLGLISVTDFMGIEYLYEMCVNWVKRVMTVGKAFQVALYFTEYRNDEMLDCAATSLMTSFSSIYRMSLFLKLPYYVVQKIVDDDRTAVYDEETIVYAIAIWLKHRWAERRAFLKPLAESVRYNFLSPKFVKKLANERCIHYPVPVYPVSDRPATTRLFCNGGGGGGGANNAINNVAGVKIGDDEAAANVDDGPATVVVAEIDEEPEQAGDQDRVDENLLRVAAFNRHSSRVSRINKRLWLAGLKESRDGKTWTLEARRLDGYKWEPLQDWQQPVQHTGRLRLTASATHMYKMIANGCTRSNQFHSYDKFSGDWMKLPTNKKYIPVYDMVNIGASIYLNTAPQPPYNRDAGFSIFQFDKSTGTWFTLPGRPNYCNRVNASALVAAGNVLMVCGGLNLGNYGTNSVVMYDPRTGRWNELRSMPKKRGYTAGTFFNDKLYVTGGVERLYNDASVEQMPSHRQSMVFCPLTNIWHMSKPMLQQKHSHQLLTNDDKLWAISTSSERDKLVEIYNLPTNRWSKVFTVDRFFDCSVSAAFM